MKSLRGLAYKSSEKSDGASYDLVASEYYDERAHPTCADFRAASHLYLKRLFETVEVSGKIADIGCGRSLVAEFQRENLVLVDESQIMIQQNPPAHERRILNLERQSFGDKEFDWIFAVLADPYNTPDTWRNIARALKLGGRCIFIVPSDDWAQIFRMKEHEERKNFARFITVSGREVFLPSLIVDPARQQKMISMAGLGLVSADHILVGDLPFIRSPKITNFLTDKQNILDIYSVERGV